MFETSVTVYMFQLLLQYYCFLFFCFFPDC